MIVNNDLSFCSLHWLFNSSLPIYPRRSNLKPTLISFNNNYSSRKFYRSDALVIVQGILKMFPLDIIIAVIIIIFLPKNLLAVYVIIIFLVFHQEW